MNILIMILVGFIAGTLAKFIIPGFGGGFIVTSVLGIVGSLVGGYAASFLGLASGSGLSIAGILTSTFGAVLVILAFKLINK